LRKQGSFSRLRVFAFISHLVEHGEDVMTPLFPFSTRSIGFEERTNFFPKLLQVHSIPWIDRCMGTGQVYRGLKFARALVSALLSKFTDCASFFTFENAAPKRNRFGDVLPERKFSRLIPLGDITSVGGQTPGKC